MSRQQEEQEQNEKVKDTAAEGKPKAAGAADGKSGTASGPECPSGTADRSAGAQGAAGKEEREVREEDAKAESAVVEDEDDEDEEMEPKQKLRQILISAALLLAAYLIDRNMPGLAMWQRLLLYLVPYFAAGFDVLKEAGEFPHEHRDDRRAGHRLCAGRQSAVSRGCVRHAVFPGGRAF